MKKYFILSAFLLLSFVTPVALIGQQNMTLYQMHDVPQSNSLNPAVPISCGWIIGFPGLGGISAGVITPLSYNNLGAGKDTLNVNDIVSKLHNKNTISTNGTINLITIGYRAERTFYQFTINERFNHVSSISKDPLVMLLKGNESYVGKTVDGAPSVNAIYYREYGFNIAHEVKPTLWMGARAKLMFGRVGLSSTSNQVDFYTDPGTYDLKLTSDVLIRGSVPGKVTLNPLSGKVSDFETNFQTSDFIFNPSNIGVGLDFGITKDFDNGARLSASVLNLGFVKWSKNLQSFRQKGTITFTGPFAPINELDALVDTVKSFLHLDYSQEAYSQMLAPVFMAGISYPVNEWLRAGATGMAEIQPNTFPWALTATAFTQGLPVIDAGLSYTVTPYSFFNIGAGVAARLGAFNIHLFADNVIGLLRPFDARYATVQLGINFRFGCGDGKSKSSTREAVPCPAFKSSINSSSHSAVPCSRKAR